MEVTVAARHRHMFEINGLFCAHVLRYNHMILSLARFLPGRRKCLNPAIALHSLRHAEYNAQGHRNGVSDRERLAVMKSAQRQIGYNFIYTHVIRV